MALEDLGDRRFANVILLAVVVAKTEIVSQGALLRAIEESVTGKFLDLNKKAVTLGFDYKGDAHER
jgi:Pyruvate/2-oxoacid:ferredoxin oxidoreductase gamma subunit